ncbi:MAG: S-methyl-5-thioribose-1-phosphate isomerase, partial [Candidatus Omnitrophica bacterium]|nr:S-methyl-5-thioribose-1-phosphate isomerase [Candidatus Omnitrophota bacterium]
MKNNEVIKLLQNLIRIDSQNPPGDERKIVDFIKHYLDKLGVSSKIYVFKKNRPNLVCKILSKNSSKKLLFAPHIDTVPGGRGWKFLPFSGKIYKKRIYGRGATDCKVNVAACLALIKNIVTKKIKLKNLDLIFAFCGDEETGSRYGIIPLLKYLKNIDWAVVLDSDDFNIVVAQKGLLHLRIELFGKEAHGAYPERGLNAILKAVDILKKIESLIEKGVRDFEEYEKMVMAFHKEEILKFEKIGEIGREILFKGIRVLTHCNTGFLATGGIGTALGIIYKNKDLVKEVYFTETRPYLQGARLTSYELYKSGIKNKMIFDFEAGIIMQRKMVDIVIVGADRIARNGDFANKTGTLILAILSNYFDIPFYVAAPISTFDFNSEKGDNFIIEERKGEEVKKIFNKNIAPPYTTAIYLSFDITPSKLVK